MSECERLADLLTRLIDGDPWHGSNLMAQLEGLAPEQAAAHPVPGAHSVWELVLHLTGWATEVRARLHGEPAGEPADGDWPAVRAVTPGAWTQAKAALAGSHVALADAVRAAGDGMLDTPVTDYRDAAAGTGMSRYLTLHGVVHHAAYHTGQMALLVKALRR